MTINISAQLLKNATSETLAIEATGRRFDVVRVYDDEGNQLNLFFEAGRGEAVAEAINKALADG
jgi:hypothetical protein